MLKTIMAAGLVALVPVLAFADGHADVEKGEKVFRKCKACHEVGDGAKAKAGPVLNGVVGRQIAAVEGFNYSDALVALGEEGKTWTAEEMALFLEKPKAYAKGTKMSFAGLRKEEDRANVIAYLATFEARGS